MQEIRDIGAKNPFSIKDGVFYPKNKRRFLWLFTSGRFLISYNFFFRTTPRKFKMHRSGHAFILFGVSLYLPYRYSA